MRTVLRSTTLVLAIALLLIGAENLSAQKNKAPQPDGNGKDVAATYFGSQGKIVQVKIGDKPWLMQLDPKVSVTFTGTAETDFVQLVQAPLMVRFKTEVHIRQRKSTETVTEIEIVSADETTQPGAVVDGLGDGFAEPAEKPKGPQPETQRYQITGPVSGYKNGEMTVLGIRVPVDPMAKVTVNLNGPAALLATPLQANTTITYKYFTKQPGRGILTKMATVSTEPLAAPKKPTPRAPVTPPNTKDKPEPKLVPDEAKPDEAKPDEAKPEEKKPAEKTE